MHSTKVLLPVVALAVVTIILILFHSTVLSWFQSSLSRQFIVGIDLTKGREEQARNDSLCIVNQILPILDVEDKIDVYVIHGRSEAQPLHILSSTMPSDKGSYEQGWKRAKEDAESLFKANWQDAVSHMQDQALSLRTDIFGFLQLCSSHRVPSRETMIILLSDMQQVGDGMNFEKEIPDSSTVRLCREGGLVSDLHGCKMYVLGCTATHGISNQHYRAIRTWWVTRFLPLTNAKLIAYSSDYEMNE